MIRKEYYQTKLCRCPDLLRYPIIKRSEHSTSLIWIFSPKSHMRIRIKNFKYLRFENKRVSSHSSWFRLMLQLLHIRLVFDPKVVKERWVDKWMWGLEGVVTFLLSLIKVASHQQKDRPGPSHTVGKITIFLTWRIKYFFQRDSNPGLH